MNGFNDIFFSLNFQNNANLHVVLRFFFVTCNVYFYFFRFKNPLTFRQNQCTSLPTDWLAQNPSFSMYLKSSQTNQSFSYLPLIDAADEKELNLRVPLSMPLSSVQAESMHNLTTEYNFDDKSPTLTASFVLDTALQSHNKHSWLNPSTNLIDAVSYPPKYKRVRSSMDIFSGGELNVVNVDEIGWKIPPKTLHGNARKKIDAIKARQSIPTSLKQMKSSVPVHSSSTLSIQNQRSLDEQIFRHSTHSLLIPQIQSLYSRKSFRNAFMKSRSFNSFENRSQSGYHSDTIESSNKSVQTNMMRTSPISTHHNFLSLDIVKSFNENKLKKIIDSNTKSGVLDTSDTCREHVSRSRKKAPEINQFKDIKNIENNKDIKTTLKLPNAQMSMKTLIKSPVRTPIRTPVRTLVRTPVRTQMHTSTRSAIMSPMRISVATPVGDISQPDLEIDENHDVSRKLSQKMSPNPSPKNTIVVQEMVKEKFKPKYKQFFELDMPPLSDTIAKEKVKSDLDQKIRIRRFHKLSHRNSERHEKEKENFDKKRNDEQRSKPLKSSNSFPEKGDEYDEEMHSDKTGSDDVFEPPVIQKVPQRIQQRRNSSFEDLSLFQAQKFSEKDLECGRSSVSKNEKPQYFEHNRKSFNRNVRVDCSYPSIANRALNFPQNYNPNEIASLQMSPKRDLLKKPTSAVVNDVPSNSNEYDGRERSSISSANNNRRAIGHQSLSSNNRESYREPSRSLSDRDQREQDSFNRSLSTNEGTPDDKIGKFHLNIHFKLNFFSIYYTLRLKRKCFNNFF